MIDYEVYAGKWMRPIRAANINNALKMAVEEMKKAGFVGASLKTHTKDGYPVYRGEIMKAGPNWVYAPGQDFSHRRKI